MTCSTEFRMTPSPWRRELSGGYAYFDRTKGSYRHTRGPSGESPESNAIFEPRLQVTDPDWHVFLLVPVHRENADRHNTEVSTEVLVRTKFVDGAGALIVRIDNVNQRARGGEWVRIGDGGTPISTHSIPSGSGIPPLSVEVSNTVPVSCLGDASCAANKIRLADAVVFIPSNCG